MNHLSRLLITFAILLVASGCTTRTFIVKEESSNARNYVKTASYEESRIKVNASNNWHLGETQGVGKIDFSYSEDSYNDYLAVEAASGVDSSAIAGSSKDASGLAVSSNKNADEVNTDEATIIAILHQRSPNLTIYFEFNSATVLDEEKSKLEKYLGGLNSEDLAAKKIALVGSADEVGTEDINYLISSKRAFNLKKIIDEMQLSVSTSAFGSGIAKYNASEEERNLSRKVEVYIYE